MEEQNAMHGTADECADNSFVRACNCCMSGRPHLDKLHTCMVEIALQNLEYLACLHFAAGQGFYYANGVALSADESYVVLAETDMIRAHKVWVNGPKVCDLWGNQYAVYVYACVPGALHFWWRPLRQS